MPTAAKIVSVVVQGATKANPRAVPKNGAVQGVDKMVARICLRKAPFAIPLIPKHLVSLAIVSAHSI